MPPTQDLSALISGISSSSPSPAPLNSQPVQSRTPAFPQSHTQPRGSTSASQPHPSANRQVPQSTSTSGISHPSELPSTSHEQHQRQKLSPPGSRNPSSNTTMHSSLSEAKTMPSPSTSLPIYPTHPSPPSSEFSENRSRPDSSTRLNRAIDEVNSDEPSLAPSIGKKRLKQSGDGLSSDGPQHQTSLQGAVGESKIYSSSLSQPTFMSSSASHCSSSTLDGSEASPSKSTARNIDNSDDHSLPSIQQQHYSQPNSVSSSLNNESSTSINLRGINT